MIGRIDLNRRASSLSQDAERYQRLAVTMGASEASVIKASSIPVDDRVLLKCRVPLCSAYGVCGNCPPHSPTPDQTRRYLASFRTAVVFRLAVPPTDIAADEEKSGPQLKAVRHRLHQLVSTLESAAFYDGHYLAAGFGSGSCKSLYCSAQRCAVLAGDKCRHSLRARPAMEAAGIDCFALSIALGWPIYPIGKSARPESIPAGFLMGLLLVG